MIEIRPFAQQDTPTLQKLWVEINRELAPKNLRDQFESYIANAVLPELDNAKTEFAEADQSGLWIVADNQIIGSFGLQRRPGDICELRRMYLRKERRGGGLAAEMLKYAEHRAHDFGYQRIILSTSEIQKAAINFYQKNNYQLERIEASNEMTTQTIGGGVRRFYFFKEL